MCMVELSRYNPLQKLIVTTVLDAMTRLEKYIDILIYLRRIMTNFILFFTEYFIL